MLLVSVLAGSAQAHGGAHALRAEVAGAVQDDATKGHHLPCQCQASAACVQAIEASDPVLQIRDRQRRALRPVFELCHERSQSVPADPPPPRG